MNIREDTIYFAKSHKDAIIPSKREKDAGYDIYARFDEESMVIPPFTSIKIPTDIRSAFVKNYAFIFYERGSTGKINLKKNAGVIDSNFRGKWFVRLYNSNTKPMLITKIENENELDILSEEYVIHPYKKGIVQALYVFLPPKKRKEISESELIALESERGEGIEGSSGK